MEDLLQDFVAETSETIELVDRDLVRFEQDPNNAEMLDRVFRLVHTVKGSCGFLGLARLESLAHAAESMMSRFREGAPVTAEAVSLILETIDAIKAVLAALQSVGREPDGDDGRLIERLRAAAGTPSSEAQLQQAEIDALMSGSYPPEAPGDIQADPAGKLQVTSSATSVPPVTERRSQQTPDRSVRVAVDTLDRLMAVVSELVLTRNQLAEAAREAGDGPLQIPLQRLSQVTAELQDGVMQARMQPIGRAWQTLPRTLRGLAATLGKRISLDLEGEDTRLDRQVIERIREALTHLVRNAADHGIETPEQRLQAGKPGHGTIRLAARHESGHIVISIADDGRGLNTEAIVSKAVRMGWIDAAEAAGIEPARVHRLIFRPGFSTSTEASSVSGRGVGLDVVKHSIEDIGGTIDVSSDVGRGAEFTLRIPLTLAIASMLIVRCGTERFAIPQLVVRELVHARSVDETSVQNVQGKPVLRLRDKMLPLVSLSSLLQITGAERGPRGFVLVLTVGSREFALLVDAVLHTEDIVVKPICSAVRQIGLYSGATIAADGTVRLILDPIGLSQRVDAPSMTAHAVATPAPEAGTDGAQPMLLFQAGEGRTKAVPLSLLARIEKVQAETLSVTEGNALINHSGQLIPVLSINGSQPVARRAWPVLIFSDGTRSVGLMADHLVDVGTARLAGTTPSCAAGVLGTAIIAGEPVDILDVANCFERAYGRSPPTQNASQESAPVLLVDDSAFYRDLLGAALTSAGYGVRALADGEAAIAAVDQRQSFRAMICDLDMPNVDGFAVAQAWRERSGAATPPLIALSGSPSADLDRRARSAGFACVVSKFDRKALLRALNDAYAADRKAAA